MRFCLIDAFADKPYSGNPAAVVQLERELKDSALQQIAMEFNQAETAFVSPREDGRFDLRWFTPLREVPLCGHATLAAAHAVWMEWQLQSHEQPIRFVTRPQRRVGLPVAQCGATQWIDRDGFPRNTASTLRCASRCGARAWRCRARRVRWHDSDESHAHPATHPAGGRRAARSSHTRNVASDWRDHHGGVSTRRRSQPLRQPVFRAGRRRR